VSCAKTAVLIEMLFRVWTQVSQVNHMLDGGPDPHTQRDSFDGDKG